MTYFTKMANLQPYLHFNLRFSDIKLSAKVASCFKVKEDLDLKEPFGFCGLINFQDEAATASTTNEQNSALGFSIKTLLVEKSFQMHFSNGLTKSPPCLMYLISFAT